MEDERGPRISKLQKMAEEGHPLYPNDFKPNASAAELQELYRERTAEQLAEVQSRHRIAGRVMAVRSFGKAAFIKVFDRSGGLQVLVQHDALGEAGYQFFKKYVEVGDIVGVTGRPTRTRTGELSLHAEELRLLTKSLRPLPEKWHGLRDVEIRYRKRYLDLIANREVGQLFVLRSRLIKSIRRFLDERGYIEVETPLMHTLAGGAAARPFITHHNALDLDLYMRIAPELFLKRLLVGGLERVYELGRCFRNEGISTQHNPEFTMLEFYQAYATFEDLMLLTEELLSSLAQELKGSLEFEVQGQKISLRPPFARLAVGAALAEALGVSPEQLWDEGLLRREFERRNIPPPPAAGAGKLQMELFEHLFEQKLQQPTFVTGFPLEVSPLARKNPGDGRLVDRFELYVCGREVANAFSELNDPQDQRQRFQAQVEARARGDEEAMPYDEDYVEALEYGMPPAGGEGIGIDRLCMLFADAASIRDVILFPLLRPLGS